jgi:hypothetical protein
LLNCVERDGQSPIGRFAIGRGKAAIGYRQFVN